MRCFSDSRPTALRNRLKPHIAPQQAHELTHRHNWMPLRAGMMRIHNQHSMPLLHAMCDDSRFSDPGDPLEGLDSSICCQTSRRIIPTRFHGCRTSPSHSEQSIPPAMWAEGLIGIHSRRNLPCYRRLTCRTRSLSMCRRGMRTPTPLR